MNILRGRFVAWLLVCIYIGMIFSLSSLSDPSIPGLQENDKIYHMIEYAILTFLLLRAMQKTFYRRFSEKKTLLFCLFISVFYGMTDELHQWFVPRRSASYGDLLADVLGALAAGVAWIIARRIWSANREEDEGTGDKIHRSKETEPAKGKEGHPLY